MKGEIFTEDNPVPKPGKRTSASGRPLPSEWFENESTPEMVEESERISAKQIDKEEEAIDKLLAGDDREFEELDY